jgi:hypothetical protein
MVRNWDRLPAYCYDTLLLGNEPTNPEPSGHPIAASVAASATIQVEAACPATRLVVANIHLNNNPPDAVAWLTTYLAAYRSQSGHSFHQTIGVHCYSLYAANCEAELRDVEAIPAYTGPLWMTEFNVYLDRYDPSRHEMASFLNYLAADTRIERAYVWTNRLDFLALVNPDGTLISDGQAYRTWGGQAWLTLLPDVIKAQQGYP